MKRKAQNELPEPDKYIQFYTECDDDDGVEQESARITLAYKYQSSSRRLEGTLTLIPPKSEQDEDQNWSDELTMEADDSHGVSLFAAAAHSYLSKRATLMGINGDKVYPIRHIRTE